MNSRLTRLRISNVEIDEFVLMESLKSMVDAGTSLYELNLSCISVHGRQLAELMECISKCGQLQYLNLSYNSVPLNKKWQDHFMEHLAQFITDNPRLILINLSGMNFRDTVRTIQWPLAKSQSLQSIHLSDNNIPKATEINMLMCFGVKNNDESSELSIAGKLDPRLLKKTAMTKF